MTTVPRRVIALEYNVGRTARHIPSPDADGISAAIPDLVSKPLSAASLRVLSVLTGRWLGTGGPDCRPTTGQHTVGCGHLVNRVRTSLRSLARDTFSGMGGSQLRQVQQALDELSGETLAFEVVVQHKRYLRQRSHILSLRQVACLDPGGVVNESVEVAWDPLLLESLVEGHFQLIPTELAVGLQGATAFRVWATVLVQPRVASLRAAGEYCEFSVTGPGPTPITLPQLGLGRSRSDKAVLTLTRAAERGNALQETYQLGVLDRSRSGTKLCVTLLKPRGSGRSARQVGPTGAAQEDGPHGSGGREARHSETSASLGSRGQDGFKNGHKTGVQDSAPLPDRTLRRPDVEALMARWPRPPTPRQVRAILDPSAAQHGGPEDGWEWNAWSINRAFDQRVDPLEFLKKKMRRHAQDKITRERESCGRGLEHAGDTAKRMGFA